MMEVESSSPYFKGPCLFSECTHEGIVDPLTKTFNCNRCGKTKDIIAYVIVKYNLTQDQAVDWILEHFELDIPALLWKSANDRLKEQIYTGEDND